MKGRNYKSSAGQPYTRQKYIHGIPPSKVAKYTTGKLDSTSYDTVFLRSLRNAQIRSEALESARVAANKVLFDHFGETGYVLKVSVYPHIILRENRMIATAGADRLQEGMRRSFGKPSGRAARAKSNQVVFTLFLPKNNAYYAITALKAAAAKLPIKTRIDFQ